MMSESILSHVALLVPSVDKSAAYLSALGYKCSKAEIFESEGTKEIYVGNYQENSGLILLLEAVGEGPYKKAMNKRGPSLHHIAIDVLDMNDFLTNAKKVGWKLHPISNSKTAWLFFKGMPLLEVHEKKILSNKPTQISEIQFPFKNEGTAALDQIIRNKISFGDELSLIADGLKLSFSKVACVE